MANVSDDKRRCGFDDNRAAAREIIPVFRVIGLKTGFKTAQVLVGERSNENHLAGTATRNPDHSTSIRSVSYTHLTLPTIYSV